MKICSPQLGVSPTSSLGGEIYDYFTLKGFAEGGISVFVYIPKDRNYDRSSKNYFVQQSIFKHIFPPILFSFICLPYLFRTYTKENFDILRIHSPRFLGLAGIVFFIFHRNVPIVCSAVSPKPSTILFIIEKYIYKISTKIIVQSHYMKNRISKDFKISKEKIDVTYGGVAIKTRNRFKEIPINDRVKKTDKVLLFMGVLNERKNPMFLIYVLNEVLNYIDNVILVFIGEGEQKKELESMVKEYKLQNNVLFISKAYNIEKEIWLGRMDIFLLPSNDEGLGLSLVEAMYFEKPAIVSNIPPFLEVINNGKNGYSLPLSAQVWAEHIVRLIKNQTLRKKISTNAKKLVLAKYNWERMYDLNKKVMVEILK